MEEGQLKSSEAQDDKNIQSTDQGKGLNYGMIFITGLMLFGPLLMGIGINSLGNDNPIRAHFAVALGYTTSPNNPRAFPAELWSLGFLYPFGGLFGSLIGALLVDKLGRRHTNLLFCAINIIGAILKIVSRFSHLALLFISRFLDGIATSGFMVSSVLLLLECLPERVEKIYKPLIQMNVNVGVLLMGILNLNDVERDNWHLIHLLTITITLILALVTFYLPESPKFIYSIKRNSEETRKVFKTLRGDHYNEMEFTKLKKIVQGSSEVKQMSIFEFLKEKRFRLAIVSLIFLHIGQQLCGINAINAFASSLLSSAGFPSSDAGGTIIFAVGVIASIIFAPIITTQRRKFLWLTAHLFMLISFCAYMINDYARGPSGLQVFWLCLFVLAFNLGPGPVVWFISLEMFPPQATGAAQGVASSFNWFANTIVYLIFPIANERVGSRIMFFFIAFETFILTYSVFFILETMNKLPNEVLDDYQRLLHGKVKPNAAQYSQKS